MRENEGFCSVVDQWQLGSSLLSNTNRIVYSLTHEEELFIQISVNFFC